MEIAIMVNMNITRVTAPDITCGGCAASIKNALARVEGVGEVDVDVATKEVSIKHDATVSRDEIVRILDNAGFPIS